jgi:hypothetical protein
MPTINGVPVNFGFTGTGGIAITGISGILLQSGDLTKGADVESARNGVGDITARGWYDIHDEATLEWVVTGTTNLSDSVTNTTLAGLGPGTIIVISACASIPGLVATNWEVQGGAKISGSNTNFKKISVTIHKRTLITAVVT